MSFLVRNSAASPIHSRYGPYFIYTDMPQTTQKRVIGRHACERCRKAKIRCLIDTLETEGKCRKCLAGGLDCEWKEISKTRVRKQTNARVADLERQLSTLTATIHDIRNGTSPGRTSQDETEPQLQSDLGTSSNNEPTGGSSSDGPIHRTASAANHISPAFSSISLPINDFSTDTKSRLVDTFTRKMLPQYPVIFIHPETSLENLEVQKPFTVNAIIAAACSILEPKLFRTMHDRNIALLSQAVIIEGRKSLDLLQALLITAIWSCPPEDLSNLNIYQWSHMACTMALELGLGGRTSLHAQAQIVEDFAKAPSVAYMERYRTMFGVYLTCSRLAVSFRRQKMISFSSSTESIIQLFLQNSQNINDRRLVAWLRLQSIAEDIETMKQNTEIGVNLLFPEDKAHKTEFSIFHDRLESWENGIDSVIWVESLRIDYGLCRSKLHELAVYYGENIHQLDLPALSSGSENVVNNSQVPVNPRHIRAVLAFIQGCQSILDVFIQADLETLRLLPTLTMFRAPFAFKALAMLRKRMENPNEAINQIIDDQTLSLDVYSATVSKVLEAASENGLYAYPALALKIRDSIVRSKKPNQQIYTLQPSQNVGHTVDQRIIPELTVADSVVEDNWELVNNLTMPFFPAQGESANWSTGFVDLDFYSL